MISSRCTTAKPVAVTKIRQEHPRDKGACCPLAQDLFDRLGRCHPYDAKGMANHLRSGGSRARKILAPRPWHFHDKWQERQALSVWIYKLGLRARFWARFSADKVHCVNGLTSVPQCRPTHASTVRPPSGSSSMPRGWQ